MRLADGHEGWYEHGAGFKRICKAAGIGEDWTPRELHHRFVSLMSESGVTLEEIARLVGHSSTATTETVYRHELRPVLQRGAEVMGEIFKVKGRATAEEHG